jgi:hypothetical protein
MSHLVGLVAIACVLTLCLESMAADVPKADLRQYSLPDTYLQCTAWTFVAPADWSKEGGVTWTGRLLPGPAYSTRLSVRDATREFRLFPTYMFVETYGPTVAPGAEIAPVLSPADCAQQIILKRCRPEAVGVRLVRSEELPQLAKETVAQARASGLAAISTMRVRSGRVLVEYTAGGNPMEEMVYCTVVDAPGSAGARLWTNERTFSYRAPKGQLKDAMPILGTIGRSLKESPQWVALRRQKLQQIVAANSAPPRTDPGRLSILDVSKKMARDQDDFLRGMDSSIAAQDRAITAAGRLGRDTQMMQDPVLGDDVEVGNGYLHYYRDYYGQVHGSDLNASDFYTTYRTNVTELQPGRQQ